MVSSTDRRTWRAGGIFEHVDLPMVVVVLDDASRLELTRCVDANPAATRLLGLQVGSCTLGDLPSGRILAQLVGASGRTGRLERQAWSLRDGRCFEAQAHPVNETDAPNHFVVILTPLRVRNTASSENPTAVVHAPGSVGEILLRISDAMRPMSDPLEIEAVVTRMVGEYLGLSRVLYAELKQDAVIIHRDFVRRGASMAGTYSCDTFVTDGLLASFEDDGLFDLEDVDTDWRLGDEQRAAYRAANIEAALVCALKKNGRFVAAMVFQSDVARFWTEPERELIREVARRTWDAVERAHSEAALRASEERMRGALSIETVGVMFFQLDGRIVDTNAAFQRLTGYGREELKGLMDGENLTAPEHRAATERALRELAERGETAPHEKQLVRKDGTRCWCLSALTRISARSNGSECVAFILDISEQKRLELQREELLGAVRAAHAEAERANAMKDDFLATLSHELRTPLAAILLWAGALRSKSFPPHELERVVDIIVQSAETQSCLINDLLDLSRLISGKLFFAPTIVSVACVVRDAIAIVKPAADAKRLAIEVDVPSEIGTVVLDGVRLKQVLWNLLTNATKFTPAGGKVSVRACRRDGDLELSVEDTGDGIAPDFMPHVFERFRQADPSAARQYGGLGIGLSLSRQLVEFQGGTIAAYSDGLGKGARFRVRLPAVDPNHLPVRDPNRVAVAAVSGAPLAGVRVLLVEDDPNTQEAMRWMLVRAGAHVVAVSTSEEALVVLAIEVDAGAGSFREAVRSSMPIDVVVSDLELSGMKGYELIERVVEHSRRHGRPSPPSCAVSAHARDLDRQRAIASGFDLYLAKPLTPERLVSAVADLRDIAIAQQRQTAAVQV
jgi:PAS domain S-box-containing protein